MFLVASSRTLQFCATAQQYACTTLVMSALRVLAMIYRNNAGEFTGQGYRTGVR